MYVKTKKKTKVITNGIQLYVSTLKDTYWLSYDKVIE